LAIAQFFGAPPSGQALSRWVVALCVTRYATRRIKIRHYNNSLALVASEFDPPQNLFSLCLFLNISAFLCVFSVKRYALCVMRCVESDFDTTRIASRWSDQLPSLQRILFSLCLFLNISAFLCVFSVKRYALCVMRCVESDFDTTRIASCWSEQLPTLLKALIFSFLIVIILLISL